MKRSVAPQVGLGPLGSAFPHPGGVRSRPRAYERLRRAMASGQAGAIAGALGRVAWWDKRIPQRGSTNAAAVGWHREGNAAPGYRNRTARRKGA